MASNKHMAKAAGPDHEVVVIGAGMAGIAMGVKLVGADIQDFVILERSSKPGGVWQNHSYPGIGVDSPAVSYDYSFSRNKHWSRIWVEGAEINANHMRVCTEYGLHEHIRVDTEVVRQVWDEAGSMWRLETRDGRVITARFLITATGQFPEQKEPSIPGIGDFQGAIQQSAHWDRGRDHAGERVAVVGTGASAVQIVPSMAPAVSQMDVYQRTPAYCFPRVNPQVPERIGAFFGSPGFGKTYYTAYNVVADALILSLLSLPLPVVEKALPVVDNGARLVKRAALRAIVKDPQTRKKLMPRHGIIAKRPTVSGGYLQAFNRSNVSLITTAIDRITAKGVRTVDGVEHEYDTIVLATGHTLFSDPEYYTPGTIIGREGFDLGKFYRENRLQAYESMAVPGLPNRWMMAGPYSFSITPHIPVEVYAESIVAAISAVRKDADAVVEVDQDVHDRYYAKMRRRSRNVEWYMNVHNKGVNTYYINSQGEFAALRMSSLIALGLRTRLNPLRGYRVNAVAHNDSGTVQEATAV